ncbi:MAG: tetratricopeptide repeat protein [Ignavibacteria bacterium]|nr:tetratricopeptide repeat protein [Ignavibacteria bacterium]
MRVLWMMSCGLAMLWVADGLQPSTVAAMVVEKKESVQVSSVRRDSLLHLLERYDQEHRADTTIVNLLCDLSYELLGMNPAQSLEYAQRAKVIAESLNDRRALAHALESVGRAYRVEGLYTIAMEYFLAMLRLGEELHDNRVQMLALRRIGQSYSSERNYAAALEYSRKFLALSTTLGDTLKRGQALNDIGSIQRELGQSDSALTSLRTALDIARAYNRQDQYLLSIVLQNIALVHSKRGEYGQARRYFGQALAMERYLDEFVGMSYCYRGLGRIFVEEKKYSEALVYAEKALALADSYNIGLEKDATFALLSDIHAGLGNAALALQYYKRSVALKDSTSGVASAQKAATMERVFQQEKNEKVRALLESAHRQEMIIRNAVIVVGILLVGLSGVLYNRYRLKVRSEEQLRQTNGEIQKQQTRLEEQARRIEEMNSELQENNARLTDTNIELDAANMELHSYIDELSRINSELDARNETLRELHREKNEFLGIVAHDLKNPLASIRLTADMLQRFSAKMSDAEKDERLKHISLIVERMMVIITNLLNDNALETRLLAVSITTVNVSEVVAMLVHEYKERATAKSIALHAALPMSPLYAQADSTMLYTVLENLLSNALKFSPPHTSVRLSIEAGDEQCRILVKDEGPGLSDDDRRLLFGKFIRLSARPTGGEHSTGLGLSIVKKMVGAMRGRVWCESELGRGATFIVELPKNA